MSKLSYRISYYVLYAMFAAILVVLGMFYFGGEDPNPMDPTMSQPIHTDALLYLNYVLFGISILVTIVAFLAKFISDLKDSPINAIKSLAGLAVMTVLMIIAWTLGSDETLNMPAYDGTENVPFWLKLTDMFLYSIYVLLVVTVLAIVASGVKKKLS